MGKIMLVFFLVFGLAGVTIPVLAQEAAPEVNVGMEDEETDIVAGKVSAVNAADNSVSVKDEAGKDYTLTATKEETSIWKGDDTIELSAVKADDPVELEYYKDKDGKMVAIWIDVLTKEVAAPIEAMPETMPPATE